MFLKIILTFLLLILSANANNEEFNLDVEDALKQDFEKYGIEYIPKLSVIRFNKLELLYPSGNSKMSEGFKKSLDVIYPKLIKLILNYKDNIENIYIKGYSSSEYRSTKKLEDRNSRNIILSQNRAYKVYQYLDKITNQIIFLDDDKQWFYEKVKLMGMGSSNLIYNSDNTENKDKSRRIEIEINFKEQLVQANVAEKKSNSVADESCRIYLIDYVKKLLIENPTVQERFEFLKAIRKDIEIANSAFRPIVALNFNHTQYQESTPDDYTDTQSKDITVRYNIFNGFKDEEQIDISKYNFNSNKYFKEQTVTDLIFSLTQTFITIERQKDILDLARENILDYDKWIAKEDIKFQNGMISLNDYSKIKSRDTMQRMNYEELNRQYKDSISTFQKYIDFHTEDIPCFEKLHPHSKYLRNKDIAHNDAQIMSPYIKEANANILLYKEKMKQQQVNFYPTVDLIGKKRIYDENYETKTSATTKDTSVAVEARLELYSGHKEQSSYEKAKIEYKQKIKKLDEVKRDTAYKINLSFNKYELTIAKEGLLNTLIEKREDSFLGATYDYNFAKIDANSLLDAVDALYNAKKSFIENQYDKQIEQYKIFATIGMIRDYILQDWKKE